MSKKYPEEFFIIKHSALDVYKTTPPGQFRPELLLRGTMACWKSEDATRTAIKKKLILIDEVIFELEDALDSLNGLLHDGFDVYIWQRDTVIKLTQELLKQLEENENSDISTIQQAMRPALDTEIIEVLQRANPSLSAAEIFLVDEYWIVQIHASDLESKKRVLNWDDLIGQFSQATAQEQEILKQKLFALKPPIKKIAVSDEQFSDEPFPLVSIFSELLARLAIEDLAFLREVPLDLVDWEHAELGSLQKLVLENDLIDGDTLNQILSKTTSLTELTVFDGSIIAYEKISFSSLEQFITKKITIDQLMCLLNNAPKLKYITIEMLDSSKDSKLPLETHTLDNIAYVKIKHCSATHTLSTILANAKNINYLDLGEAKDLNQMHWEFLSFPKLTTFKVSDPYLLDKNVSHILRSAKKIINLSLRKTICINDMEWKDVSLGSIESLSLGYSNLFPRN